MHTSTSHPEMEKAQVLQTAKQHFAPRFQVPFEEITLEHESIPPLPSRVQTRLVFAWSVDPLMVVNELETIQVLG